jgi:hypothetical protein
MKRFLMIISCASFFSAACASPFFVGLNVGSAISGNLGKTQTLTLNDVLPFPSEYTANSTTKNTSIVEAELGWQKLVLPKVTLQLGLSVLKEGSRQVSGEAALIAGETADADYQYTVNVQSTQLFAHLIYAFSENWQTGAGLSVGTAKVDNSNFSYSTDTLGNPFSDNTSQNSAWGLTLFEAYQINAHVAVKAGYAFDNFGKSYLGTAPIDTQSTDETLQTSPLTDNRFFIGVNYFI